MDIRKVAGLAHLEITEDEIRVYEPQMNEIVSYIEQLNELDTSSVEASIGGLTAESESTDADRNDVRVKSLGQKKALDQAPASVKGHFQVPKVL